MFKNWKSSFKGWKISTFNGVLIASYFIPAWAMSALKIVNYPVRGLYARANIAPTIFASDYLQFGAIGMMRFAWLLALAKFTVVAFFSVFTIQTLREPRYNRGASDEALSLALIIGAFISFASMLFAAKVGELDALRLHATESLLLLSIGIVLLVETETYSKSALKSASKSASKSAAQPGNGAPTIVAGNLYPLSSPNS